GRDLSLEPGQRRAQAAMDPELKARCRGSPRPKSSRSGGLREVRRVAVGGAEEAEHEAAVWNRHAAYLDIGRGHAPGPLDRAVVAQELLDRGRQEIRGVRESSAQPCRRV